MLVKICDKCGKKIIDEPSELTSMLFPTFNIERVYKYNLEEINLCCDCAKAFEIWLKEKEGQNAVSDGH